MKKILLSAFALFASMAMVNAQNLLTAGNFDADLLGDYVANPDWQPVDENGFTAIINFIKVVKIQG